MENPACRVLARGRVDWNGFSGSGFSGFGCRVLARGRVDWNGVVGSENITCLSRPRGMPRGLKQEAGSGNIRIFPKYAWIGIKCQVFFCLDLLNFNEYKTKKEGDHWNSLTISPQTSRKKLRIRKYAGTSAIRILRLDQKCRISNTKKMITRFFMVPPPDII